MRAAAALAFVLTSGCAHVATLRPAEKGTVQVELGLGGPIFKQGGAAVPATLTSIGARYGLRDRADVQVHLHTTAALLGILGVDVGSSAWVVQGERFKPDVTATIRLIGFTDFHSPFRPYVQLGAVASWRLFRRFAPYVGVDVVGPGPYLGVAVGVQGTFGRFTLQLEGKGFLVARELYPLVKEWVAPADLGSFGAQLGVGYRLGGP